MNVEYGFESIESVLGQMSERLSSPQLSLVEEEKNQRKLLQQEVMEEYVEEYYMRRKITELGAQKKDFMRTFRFFKMKQILDYKTSKREGLKEYVEMISGINFIDFSFFAEIKQMDCNRAALETVSIANKRKNELFHRGDVWGHVKKLATEAAITENPMLNS